MFTGDAVTLTPGKRYKLSFDYKVIGTVGDITFRIYDASSWKDWKFWTSPTTGNQWQHKEGYVQFATDGGTDNTIAPASAANLNNIYGRFSISSGPNGSDVIFDNVKLIEESP